MRIYMLDTCAISDLVEHSQFALARHRLLDEVADGRIVVLGTHPLLWELPALHGANRPLFEAFFDFLLRISRGRVLLHPAVRQEHEVRAKGRLDYPAFVDSEGGIVYVRDAERLAEDAAFNVGHALGLQFSEKEKAMDAADFLDEEGRRQAKEQGEAFEPDAWHRALKHAVPGFWYDQADHHAKGAMERAGVRAKLATDRLDHRQLPSCWASAVIHAARVRAVLVGRTNPAGRKSVSKLDLLHLGEAAAYADVFVTSDRRLRAFATSVKRSLQLRCEVLSVEDWVQRLTR